MTGFHAWDDAISVRFMPSFWPVCTRPAFQLMNLAIPMSSITTLPTTDFNEDQKAYLSGFVLGVLNRNQLPFLGQLADGRFTHENGPGVAENVHGTPIEGGPDAPNGLVTTGNIVEPPRARIFTLDEQAGHHAQAFLANPAIGDAG